MTRIAWLTFKRGGAKFILMFVAIAVLFGLVTVVVSLAQALQSFQKPDFDSRVARVAPGPGRSWTKPDLDKLGRIPHLDRFSPMLLGMAVNPKDATTARAWGCTPAWLEIADNLYVPPDAVQRWTAQRDGLIVGGDLAAAFGGLHEGQDLKIQLKEGPQIDAHIVYVAKTGLSMFFNLAYLDEAMKANGQYDPVWIITDAGVNRAGVLAAITKEWPSSIINTREDTRVSLLGVAMLLITLYKWTGVFAAALTAIMCLTVLTLSIDERRRELATLRAIGCRQSGLVKMIVVNALLLMMPGAIFGSLAAFGLFYGGKIALSPSLVLHITPVTVAIVCGFALLMTFLIAIVPARRAAATDVLMTLRGE